MEQVVYCNVGEGQYGLKFTSEIGFFSYFTDYPIGMDDLNALPDLDAHEVYFVSFKSLMQRANANDIFQKVNSSSVSDVVELENEFANGIILNGQKQKKVAAAALFEGKAGIAFTSGAAMGKVMGSFLKTLENKVCIYLSEIFVDYISKGEAVDVPKDKWSFVYLDALVDATDMKLDKVYVAVPMDKLKFYTQPLSLEEKQALSEVTEKPTKKTEKPASTIKIKPSSSVKFAAPVAVNDSFKTPSAVHNSSSATSVNGRVHLDYYEGLTTGEKSELSDVEVEELDSEEEQEEQREVRARSKKDKNKKKHSSRDDRDSSESVDAAPAAVAAVAPAAVAAVAPAAPTATTRTGRRGKSDSSESSSGSSSSASFVSVSGMMQVNGPSSRIVTSRGRASDSSAAIHMPDIGYMTKTLQWSSIWWKEGMFGDYTKVYVTPYMQIEGDTDDRKTTRPQLIENLQMFISEEAFKIHVHNHPWLLEDFGVLKKRLENEGWERVDGDKQDYEEGHNFWYQFTPALDVLAAEGRERKLTLGVHKFASALALVQYIHRFPFLLQDDKTFAETLLSHRWTNCDGKFKWTDGVEKSVKQLKRLLWVFPEKLYRHYGIAERTVFDAIRVPEEAALLPETEAGSPLPKDMTIASRKALVDSLYTKLEQYYHKCNKESTDDLFLYSFTGQQKELHTMLAQLNWRVNDPADEHSFVAPWARKDIGNLVEMEDTPQFRADLFDHVYDIAALVVKYKNSDLLIHRMVGASVECRYNPSKKFNASMAIFKFVQKSSNPFETFLFEKLLLATGWTIVPFPGGASEEGEDGEEGDVEVVTDDAVSVKESSFKAPLAAQRMFIPFWSKKLAESPENYKLFTAQRDYFVTEQQVLKYLRKHNNEPPKAKVQEVLPPEPVGTPSSEYYFSCSSGTPMDSIASEEMTDEQNVKKLIRDYRERRRSHPDNQDFKSTLAAVLKYIKKLGWRNVWNKAIKADVDIYFAPWCVDNAKTATPKEDGLKENLDYFVFDRDNEGQRALMRHLYNFSCRERPLEGAEQKPLTPVKKRKMADEKDVNPIKRSSSTSSTAGADAFASASSPSAQKAKAEEASPLTPASPHSPTTPSTNDSLFEEVAFLDKTYFRFKEQGTVVEALNEYGDNYPKVFPALKQVGWRCYHCKVGELGDSVECYVPPWSLVAGEELVTLDKQRWGIISKAAKLNVDYFTDKVGMFRYIRARGFDERRLEDVPKEMYVKLPKSKQSKGKSAAQSTKAGVVESESDDDEVKDDDGEPVARTKKSRSKASVPKKVRVQAPLAPKFPPNEDETHFTHGEESFEKTGFKGLIIQGLRRGDKFQHIFPILQSLGWMYIWCKPLGADKDFYIPPWSVNLPFWEKKGKATWSYKGAKPLDFLENVDYFGEKDEVLEYIKTKGFYRRETDLAEELRCSFESFQAAAPVSSTSAAGAASKKRRAISDPTPEGKTKYSSNLPLNKRSPIRGLYKAADLGDHVDRLVWDTAYSPIVGGGEVGQPTKKRVDVRAGRSSSSRRLHANSDNDDNEDEDQGSSDYETESEGEEEMNQQVAIRPRLSKDSSYIYHLKSQPDPYEEDFYSDNDDDRPELIRLLECTAPSFYQVFKELAKTKKWKSVKVDDMKDYPNLAQVEGVNRHDQMVYLRDGCTIHSENMIYNEDYFYFQSDLIDHLKVSLGVVTIDKLHSVPRPAPDSAFKFRPFLMSDDDMDVAQSDDDATVLPSSNSKDYSSLVNHPLVVPKDATLGWCIDMSRAAFRNVLNPLLFTSKQNTTCGPYVRPETLQIYSLVCEALLMGQADSAYIWGATGAGKTLAVNSVLAQIKHNRRMRLGLSDEGSQKTDSSDEMADLGFNVISITYSTNVFANIAAKLNLGSGNSEKLVENYFTTPGTSVDATEIPDNAEIETQLDECLFWADTSSSPQNRKKAKRSRNPMTILSIDEIDRCNDDEIRSLLAMINRSRNSNNNSSSSSSSPTHHCSVILLATCNMEYNKYMNKLNSKGFHSFGLEVAFKSLTNDCRARIVRQRGCGLFDEKAIGLLAARGEKLCDVRLFLEMASNCLQEAIKKLSKGNIESDEFQEELLKPVRAIVDVGIVSSVTAKKDPTIENINSLDHTAQAVMVCMLTGERSSYTEAVLYDMYLNLFSTFGVDLEGSDNMAVRTAVNTLVSLKIASTSKALFKLRDEITAELLLKCDLLGLLRKPIKDFITRREAAAATTQDY